jgi:hypothetical protein
MVQRAGTFGGELLEMPDMLRKGEITCRAAANVASNVASMEVH